jgi:hypothetical protein
VPGTYSVALVVLSEIRSPAAGDMYKCLELKGTKCEVSAMSKLADVPMLGYQKFWTNK